jgi:hypothetical protein
MDEKVRDTLVKMIESNKKQVPQERRVLSSARSTLSTRASRTLKDTTPRSRTRLHHLGRGIYRVCGGSYLSSSKVTSHA